MWKISSLKQDARQAMRGNYASMVAVSVVLFLFTGAYTFTTFRQTAPKEVMVTNQPASNTEVVNSALRSFGMAENKLPGRLFGSAPPQKGILAGFFNNITKSGSFVFGILNALNQFLFEDSIVAGIIILVGAALSLLHLLLLQSILRIGGKRFFLESRLYPKTGIARILYLLKVRTIGNPIKVMLVVGLRLFLWFFTIIGGFIKLYSYRMVPYILAENPATPPREAIRLSAHMMHKNKWNTFLMDCSFLHWAALSFFTGGIAGFFLVNPYLSATEAGLYANLRATALHSRLPEAAYLNDHALFILPEGYSGLHYPSASSPLPESKSRMWLTSDFHRIYSLHSYILLFFTFAFAGWLWEVFIELFGKGIFVNRGVLLGPWLPIYGTGALAVLLLLRKSAQRPMLAFGLVMLLAGAIEYCASLGLEALHGQRWWDYTDYFLNLHGRVCLEGLLVFGLGGCLVLYFLGPLLDNFYQAIPARLKTILCLLLCTVFIADLAYSFVFPNTGAEITYPLQALSAVGGYVFQHGAPWR